MLDIILLLPLLFGAYAGFRRGLLMELIGIVALILAILGAFKLLQNGIEFLSRHIPEYSNIIPFLAFFGLFIGILLIINVLGGILKRILDLTILGSFDSIAGAIVGIFKWAFIISVLLWLLEQINVTVPENLVEHSWLYPHIINLAPAVGQYVSSIFPFADNLFESIRQLFNRQ